ncbi:MAG TPA: TMEM175 family protein [Nitrososphaeraceae archaeon]|nr:TMEM175 family protein [Nitrososphaeraceae archaeon]
MDDDKNIHGKIRLEHVISFADAIFAFSITFMAISIQIPDLPHNDNIIQTELIAKLLELRPQFETYVISFFIIGIYWISYHQVFNNITGSHTIMIWLNLLFLFFITLISFATGLQINYGPYHIIFIIYALILTITGSLLASIWLHAKKNNLIDKRLSRIQTRNIFLQSLLPPTVFVISILISFVNIQIAYYFWMVIIPGKIILRKISYPY